MTNRREFLGKDNYGKPWYVYVERHKNQISFFIFPKEQIEGERYIVKAIVTKISKNRAIIEEFIHTNHEYTQDFNKTYDYDFQDDVYQDLCIEEPELEIDLPNKVFGHTLTEFLSEQESLNSSNIPNWENRGIGKLLLGRVEKWARRAHVRALFGFLSKRDDISKLKIVYAKWGWRVKIFQGNRPKIDWYNYAVGIFMKKMRS